MTVADVLSELAEAVWLYDERVGVGDEVEPDYCDCDLCQAQSRLRRALDAYSSTMLSPT